MQPALMISNLQLKPKVDTQKFDCTLISGTNTIREALETENTRRVNTEEPRLDTNRNSEVSYIS